MKFLIAVSMLITLSTAAFTAENEDATLIAMEKDAWTAGQSKNRAFYEQNIDANTIRITAQGLVLGREAVMAVEFACDLGDHEFDDMQVHYITDDVAILTFTAVVDSSCAGEAETVQVIASSTYVKRDGKWMSVLYHSTRLPN